ncbi:MAG: hypothetical protein NVS2B3_16860 [Vulcanimicrobiaceae bacterium]
MLNPRQLCLYLYLTLLTSETGVCYPTTKQIRQDLGLASLTIVFEAMSILEHYGFILRQRQTVVELKSRRNVYQRPSCEFTILRLLDLAKIDGQLRPGPGAINEMSSESQKLRDEWLANKLGSELSSYNRATADEKRAILARELRAMLEHDARRTLA